MKRAIFIEGRREGYAVSQCGETMTAGELIDFLKENFEEEEKVYLMNDNGYTYGSITNYSIDGGEIDKDGCVNLDNGFGGGFW